VFLVHSESYLEVENSKFENNFAVGGAIGLLDYGKFKAINSTFESNIAINTVLFIINDKSELTMIDSHILKNYQISKSDFRQESRFCI